MNNIYIIGFMGSGKSTLTLNIKKTTDKKALSTDTLIEEKAGISISNIFSKYGEDYFRKLEQEVLDKVSKSDNLIVDCGGGIPLCKENAELIKRSGKVIYLKASAPVIFNRLKNDNLRPLLQNKKSISEISDMLSQRELYYEKIADVTIDTDGLTPKEILEKTIPFL
ncbi:MAG: shikimate kinase [Eubacterium sp.]|nr:shikimate kinase [Eubacterium sp.]